MCGILGILVAIQETCQVEKVEDEKITIYCDHKASIDAVSNWTVDRVTPKTKNTDLVSAVLSIRDTLPIKIHCIHVYGHQDEQTPIHLLSQEAKKNIEMDLAAKQLVTTVINSGTKIPQYCNHPAPMPIHKWQQFHISQEYSDTLYYMIYKKKMQQYWMDKKSISKGKIDTINYTGMSRGMKAMTVTLKHFASKWMLQSIGIGKNMQRWQLRNDGYCPYCTDPTEDTTHILLCKHEDSRSAWKEQLQQYLKSVLKAGTCTTLTHALKYNLMAWRDSTTYPSLDSYPTSIKRIIIEQRKLGCQSFLEGIKTCTWATYMKQFFQQSK